MRLVNLCPHFVEVLATDGKTIITLDPAEKPARVNNARRTLGFLTVGDTAVRVTALRSFEVRGLPDPVDGVYYVVSSIVAQALPEREDLLVPGNLVRSTKGEKIRARELMRIEERRLMSG